MYKRHSGRPKNGWNGSTRSALKLLTLRNVRSAFHKRLFMGTTALMLGNRVFDTLMYHHD